MTQQAGAPLNPSTASASEPPLLWTTAALVAGLGAWILFDALPGINWVLWTGAAVAGLLRFARGPGQVPMSVAIAPVAIAGAAAVTASPELLPLICIAVMFFLSMLMLLSTGQSFQSITARFAVTAPFVAFGSALVQAMHRGTQATHRIRSSRARAWVRGLAISLPVVIVFALLLAGADPVFAAGRDTVARLFANWDFVPRVVFFFALLVLVIGAYGYASKGPRDAAQSDDSAPVRWFGSTERLMLLGSVAALLWLFLALQVGYLFGNVPRIADSGMTFAEYARRGFGELTVVASASALLIVVSELFGNDDGRERTLRLVTFAVIGAVLLLLGSAFRRVLLYEAAYGFTTARLYAQFYMGAVAAGLALLFREVAADFDANRLFRRAVMAATILFLGLAYWNHEAWIARRNIDRFATSGKLDVEYLARGLSLDALPAIAERLPSVSEPMRTDIVQAVAKRYTGHELARARMWYEWSLGGSRGRAALNASFGVP